jgi:hypothetical protein
VRKRHGRAVSGREEEKVQPVSETEATELASHRAPGKREFSWITAITVGAGLALDIIRVIREATDLHRKLFPVKHATAGQISNRESG